jgi:hypothetical protein
LKRLHKWQENQGAIAAVEQGEHGVAMASKKRVQARIAEEWDVDGKSAVKLFDDVLSKGGNREISNVDIWYELLGVQGQAAKQGLAKKNAFTDFLRRWGDDLGLDEPGKLQFIGTSPLHMASFRAEALKLGIDDAALAMFDAAIKRNLTRNLIHQWAITSADEHLISLALQRAAVREFGLKRATVQHLTGPAMGFADDFLAAHEAALRGFLRAQYELTQRELAKAGFDHVTLWRGMTEQRGSVSMGDWIRSVAKKSSDDLKRWTWDVRLQPISSFSSSPGTAENFGSTMMLVRVPRSRVMSFHQTGFGCLSESEFTILGDVYEDVFAVLRPEWQSTLFKLDFSRGGDPLTPVIQQWLRDLGFDV